MNEFQKRLILTMNERKMKASDLARASGVGKSDISNYVNGVYKAKQDKILLLAQALSVDPGWLSGTEVDTSLPNNVTRLSEMPHYRIPLIGDVAAGVPILAEQEYDVYVDSPIKADYALRVEGDSMEPTYLNGDIVYIRQTSDVDDGRVAVVLLDDSATMKHVYHIPNGLSLISENPHYRPMTMTFDEFTTIRILGTVCGYTRMYK